MEKETMLDEKLIAYKASDFYPFHMPGHKRRLSWEENPYQMDITEIDGFDNLHDAQGILKEAQERASKLYGAKRSFFLINGSTCGLLAAICAATKRGGTILVARNCHKAVYHGIYLQQLEAHYIYPKMTSLGIMADISPEMVRAAFKEQEQIGGKKVEALLITSPTYDGVVSDIEEIAKIAHSYGAKLIVDEAHGAHFGMDSYFPQSAVNSGADIIIQSLHKTLPAFTQTAIMHLMGDKELEEKVASYLDIFETSSPSYVLMAGIDRCIRIMTEEKEALFEEYRKKLEDFHSKVKDLKYLKVLTKDAIKKEGPYDYDSSKIIISTAASNRTGNWLMEELREKYHLELEMAAPNYVLAMTSPMDTWEGLNRLANALVEIDQKIQGASAQEEKLHLLMNQIYDVNEVECTIAQALDCGYVKEELDKCVGQIAATYLYLYPPGIPLLAPGERIEERHIADIHRCMEQGLHVVGLEEEKQIRIMDKQP